MIIKSDLVWYRDKFQPLMIEVTDGIITRIGNWDAEVDEVWIGKVVPGFIDTHDHGALGNSANYGDHAYLEEWSKFLLKEGITSFYPTTSTLNKEGLMEALRTLGSFTGTPDGANFLGINAEGPMFSTHPNAIGAHMVENIFMPTDDLLEEMWEASNHKIALITIAPDPKGAMEIIKAATELGIVVMMGHMQATTAQVYEAMDNGAKGLTHLFNGMNGIHHRDLGPAGVGLVEDALYVELIADGVHVSDEAIKLVYKAKDPNKIITITDAIFAKGIPTGVYPQANKDSVITVDEKGNVYLESGRLAGSTNKLNNLVRHQVEDLGISFHKVIDSVTINPATLMGLNKGEIKVGKDADLIALDEDYNVVNAMVSGKVVECK